MSNWPDPDKPFVPLHPEKNGWHMLHIPGNPAQLYQWLADEKGWLLSRPGLRATITHWPEETQYFGPCLPPADYDALKADLTHWQECCHAFEFDLQSARAENARLRLALLWYAGAWPVKLVCDGGAIARAALEEKP